jgi:tetratricopeptide (TPR) repeat protein
MVGGNTNINNINNINNNNFNNFGGGWGGGWGGGFGGWGLGGLGGWGLGGWGLGGWGLGGWGLGGWGLPFYGGWWNGWGGNLGSFWGGWGLGALTSFGLGGLTAFNSPLGAWGAGGWGFPVYGGWGFGTGMGVYDYFPTWGVSGMDGWGLGSVASDWLSNNYSNPYNTSVVATQPASTTIVYDYSQPINVTVAPPDQSAADSSEQVFSGARGAFKGGDYQRALDLTDQAIKITPNIPVIHEFRSLCLFALGRYDEAASVAYAVLSAGPCWNWSTLVGLYSDVETYTKQLRGLEAAIRAKSNAIPPRFLLAYHYLVEGNNDAAAKEFATVARVAPEDQLSTSFAKTLAIAKEPATAPPAEAPTAVAGAQPTTTDGKPLVATTASVANASVPGTVPAPDATASTAPAEAPPPPPSDLVGTWKAAPAADTNITLALEADGAFKWDVTKKGKQTDSVAGRAYFINDVLSLTHENGPPLAGKIESKDASKFVFRLMGGGSKAPAFTFTH